MRIVYIHTGSSSFVSSDSAIFSAVAPCSQFAFDIRRKWLTPFVLIHQLFFLIKGIFSTKLYICQFAGYHSFLPVLIAKITGKKSLIISGGTDCVSFPGIGYGNFNKRILGWFTKMSFRMADHLSPKHETLLQHHYTYDAAEPPQQGILAFVPDLKKPATVIHNGYDAEKWKPSSPKTPLSFITLCGGWQFSFQEQLKGIDLILEAAREFPQCQFTIAGVPNWKKFENLPANITILPPISNALLAATFSRYEYYLQLSMAEGFPNALCEAMLCECIPVVSGVFSMPEIAGDSGYVLMKRDSKMLADLIHQIISNPDPSKSAKARNRIAENYSLEKRKTALINLIRSLGA